MAVKTVTGTALAPDGSARKNAFVVATLSQSCVITGTSEIVPSQVSTTTAVDGTFSLSLEATNDMTPNNTFYTVSIVARDGGSSNYTIQVPQTAGPFEISNITTSTPTASPTPSHVSTLTVGGGVGSPTITNGDIAVRSLTVVSGNGPYTPNAGPGQMVGRVFDHGGDIFNVRDPTYGAKGDGQTVSDGVMNGTTAVLTSASGKFVSGDVGKLISVAGAGAAGVNLNSTIASYQSATQVTLAAVSATAVGSAVVYWGTDDTAAMQAAYTAAITAVGTTAAGGLLSIPGGIYMMSNELIPSGSAHIEIAGVGWGNPPNATGNWGPPTSGTILIQTGTSKAFFRVNRQINGISVQDLAMVFTASTTSHGVFLDPFSFLNGTSPGFTGLCCCLGLYLSNLLVVGTDANHYDYYLGNVVNGHLSDLQGSGSGGFYKFFSYHPAGASATFNFGNLSLDGYWQHTAPVGVTYNPNVAVISYEGNNNTTAGTPTLNYIRHRGTVDVILNHNLTNNFAESVSTGSHSCLFVELTVDHLIQNDLGVFIVPISNNGGLSIGLGGELVAPGLEWLQQINQRPEYTPALSAGSASGTTPANVISSNNQQVSSGVFRATASLNVSAYVSGTVTVTVSYTSAWDSLVKTITLCTLSGTGPESVGSALAYVKGGTTITVAVAGVFSATFHAMATLERMAN